MPNATPYVKDGINDAVVQGYLDRVNPEERGSKVAAHFRAVVPPGETFTVQVRFTNAPAEMPFADFDAIFARRIAEADEFYAALARPGLSEDERRVQRQTLAGLTWSKQFYHYSVERWLDGDPGQPPPPAERRRGRNAEWRHLDALDVLSMPDKWEYPWFAAWDLAFHTVPIAMIDPEWAKRQLIVLLREWYMHPNGQIPGYEWKFSDVNPPVHAWAALQVYRLDREQRGQGDADFLERIFHKLLLNFTWWVNRVNADGHNVFQGGSLGLDNIGLFDRSAPLPIGGHIHRAGQRHGLDGAVQPEHAGDRSGAGAHPAGLRGCGHQVFRALHHSAHHVVGDRFALLAHAVGFIDPLYSKGLYVTHMSLMVLADLLLKAHETGDYSAAAFMPLEELTLRYMGMHDQLVAGSFKAWSHPKLWQVYAVLWLLGAYLEYLKLTVTRLRARDRADYLAQLSGLRLAGGGFSEFFALQEQIDALIDRVNPDDEADVARTVAQIRELFGGFKWLSSAFRDLLAGKNHLPNNKLRVNLLNRTDGFLGDGVYNEHFFGDASLADLAMKAVREQARYSVPALNRQRRTRARLATQIANPKVRGKG